MSLEIKINADIKAAMLAKEKEKLEALRAIKAAVLLLNTEKGNTEGVSETDELKMLQRLVKQRKESALVYGQQGRQDLADSELFQASVIETYLPKQMDEAEITQIIKGIIEKSGATSAKDMGKVMGLATKELAGKADNKIVSSIVKNLLG
ncbi:MAG: GatB/YqeY domain-containing protein [Bacteroidales bacterium]|nr:GatB/YqeY domain-containing protein [Bacteroidales bacterium]